MDIFISYSRVDKVRVFSIVENIKQNTGLDFWIDLDGIESGDAFEHKIINAINNSQVVLFMMSKKSVSPYIDEETGKPNYDIQTWTEKEVKYALAKKKRVVLISLDGTTAAECDWLAFNCSGLDMIDYRNADQQQKLINNLMHWIKGEDAHGHKIVYHEEKPDNHILLCILSSICCCAPIGIYSIVLSGKVDYLYRKGDFTASREMSKKAKKWALISLCLGYLLLCSIIGIIIAVSNEENNDDSGDTTEVVIEEEQDDFQQLQDLIEMEAADLPEDLGDGLVLVSEDIKDGYINLVFECDENCVDIKFIKSHPNRTAMQSLKSLKENEQLSRLCYNTNTGLRYTYQGKQSHEETTIEIPWEKFGSY